MKNPQPSFARYIHITGVVQGVEFRPFVYNMATGLGLVGWVLNSSSGVEIEAAGSVAVLDEFVARLRTDAPPLSRIEQVAVTDIPFSESRITNPGEFVIRHSEARPGEFQYVCLRLREAEGLNDVALSGGVFQNVTLLANTLPLLQEAGFTVYTHHLTPPNDGGISLGQAVIAAVKAGGR